MSLGYFVPFHPPFLFSFSHWATFRGAVSYKTVSFLVVQKLHPMYVAGDNALSVLLVRAGGWEEGLLSPVPGLRWSGGV